MLYKGFYIEAFQTVAGWRAAYWSRRRANAVETKTYRDNSVDAVLDAEKEIDRIVRIPPKRSREQM
ncbi:MAG TPA: hypothetical protein VIK33_16260 [Anaerolineae bacterium]